MRHGLLNHLDLTVTDLARSIAFYDRVLGQLGYSRSVLYAGDVPCWQHADEHAAFSIGLHVAREATPHQRYRAGLHHLAFHMDSRAQIDALHARLAQDGVVVLDPPAEYDYTPGYYALFVADPDGLKLEFVYEPRLAPAPASPA